MSEEEIEEIETLEIDFKDTDELELALEVSSKKAIYLIDDLIKHLFKLQQENKELKEHIEKYEHYCKTTGIKGLMKENKKLQERINKAIEYINKMFETGFYNDDYYLGHLKMILKDKEVE